MLYLALLCKQDDIKFTIGEPKENNYERVLLSAKDFSMVNNKFSFTNNKTIRFNKFNKKIDIIGCAIYDSFKDGTILTQNIFENSITTIPKERPHFKKNDFIINLAFPRRDIK